MWGGDRGGLRGIGNDILRAAAVDVAGKALVGVGTAVTFVFGLLVWRGGSIPAWLLLLVVVALIALMIVILRQQNSTLAGVAEDKDALQQELERHNAYSGHLQYSLDALQRVISGEVDAEIPYFLEQAVLEPARSILNEKPAENVRLSILLPTADDPDRWSMPWSAGHSMIGKSKYDELIGDTLARHAFERGEPQDWGDTEGQTDFRQNPRASALTRSFVSIPIRKGDDVLGVFNAVSAERNAFDDAEKKFLASLAGIVAVAVGVWSEDS